MSAPEWVIGDRLQLPIPTHPEILRAGGEELLNRLFHAFGSLPMDNRIAEIIRFELFHGGGTGRKVELSVRYYRPDPELPTDLFVKFSRDYDDPIRDRARVHMGSEVRFAALSRVPGFPIAVPKCMFADFAGDSETGVLITERIEFGVGAIERHYPKCLDEQMPDPLAHYRALIMAVARLAGTHKAGKLAPDIASQFPFELEKALSRDRLPALEVLAEKIRRIAEFASAYPQLLPEALRSPAFLDRFAREAASFHAREAAIKRFLHADPDLIALCHWNANVDNAWFWRDPQGTIQCGLLDWGSVGQMSVAMTLWGCLSGGRTAMWDEYLDPLLALFVGEYGDRGGPRLDIAEVKCHLALYVAMMGLTWLTDAPSRIIAELSNLGAIEGPLDPSFTSSETARTQLLMMTNFLNLWRTSDMNGAMARTDALDAGCTQSIAE